MIDPVQAMSMLASSTQDATDAYTRPKHTPPPIIPGPRVEEVHDTGKKALWVFFVLMVVSSVIGAGMSWNVPLKKRALHTITTLAFITASISYFAMATGHSVAFQRESYRHPGHHHGWGTKVTFRQVFWARYVDWAITSPLLLLNLAIVSGLAGGHIVMLLAADLILILSGLFAALANTETQHWGWYTIACIAYLFVIWHLAVNARASAVRSRSDQAQKLAGALSAYTLLLWAIYIVIWAVGRGTALISVDGEIVAYGVLDLLAKPVFGIWLLGSRSVVTDNSLDVNGFWANDSSGEGRLRLGDDGA